MPTPWRRSARPWDAGRELRRACVRHLRSRGGRHRKAGGRWCGRRLRLWPGREWTRGWSESGRRRADPSKPRLWRFPGSRLRRGRWQRRAAAATAGPSGRPESDTSWARLATSGILVPTLRVPDRIPERWQTALLALALFSLNLYICRELFGIEYLFNMGSIECVYFGIDRWVMAHSGDLKWFPLWYDGIPFQNAYPPMLQTGVVLVAKVMGFSVPHAHHWVIALAYCLGPVAVFALALRLSGSRWAGFVAGLIYSCVSMSAWL